MMVVNGEGEGAVSIRMTLHPGGRYTCGSRSSARSDQVESPGRKELAQVQWLEHDPQKWFPFLRIML
jgi:hypothetical protein